MRRAELALVWTCAAAAVLLARPALADESQPADASEPGRGEEREREPEADDDSDSAPFMKIVRAYLRDRTIRFSGRNGTEIQREISCGVPRGSVLGFLLWSLAYDTIPQELRPAGVRYLHQIVVVHGDGRRCGGSLVSLRTALTSAWCARGEAGAAARELLALAPAPPPERAAVRRVARVALAAGADADAPQAAWAGAAVDIAVLELDAPFGGGARSRPILMATLPEDCAAGAVCHVVRAVGSAPHLRIVDGALVPGDRCGAVAPGWPGLRETALCLSGPTLCSSDRGAGVVCDGKLCGVLSRSASARNGSLEAGATTGAEAPDDTCGDTHVAQSVARWRRFLHCAHTLRACGSGGECAQLCSERQLMAPTNALANDDEAPASAEPDPTGAEPDTDTDAPESPAAPTPPPSSTDTSIDTFVTVKITPPLELIVVSSSMRTLRGRTRATSRSAPTHTAPAHTAPAPRAAPFSTPRPSFEFEPNRADFKGKPARTSPYLKGGEYGDNAADYGDDEEGAPEIGPPPASHASVATRHPPAPPPSARVTELAMAAQYSVTPRAHSQAAAPRRLLPFLGFVTVLLYVRLVN